MFDAMESMNIHPKFINVIRSLYKNTMFKVEIEGTSSKWMTQETGIRQGCPLSPYLFITVMTVMFKEIKAGLDYKLIENSIPGAHFDEVMYADDTICISQDTKTMNQYIQKIEQIGKEYGMMLNKAKCELLTTEKNPNIHFADHQKVLNTAEVKYLGCQLNQAGDNAKEIGKRISNAYQTLQKLNTFWRRSNCPLAYKITALDAVVRAKLIYGTDSMQLNTAELRRMETFHLKAMRKLIRWDTTFVNRANTNEKVYLEVNRVLLESNEEVNKQRKLQNKKTKKTKPIITFAEFHQRMKLKRFEKTVNSKDEIHTITFEKNLVLRTPMARRPGRPKLRWAEQAIIEYWKEITKKFQYSPMNDYNPKDQEQKTFIKKYASAAIIIKEEEWGRYENTQPLWIKTETGWTRTRPNNDRTEPRHADELLIYTDGSCKDNKEVKNKNCPAGWGAVIIGGGGEDGTHLLKTGRMIAKLWGPVQTKHRHEDFLGAEYGSNNTGEISAICEALKWLINESSTRNAAIYYDSKYAAKVTTGEYMAKNNKLLVATARQLLQAAATNRIIRFEHVKGHNQDIGNDWADYLADLGANENSTRINIPQNEREVIQPVKKPHTETEVQRRNFPTHIEPEIRIPTPVYTSGATRRNRFAFGNVSAQQARWNTNLNINPMLIETAVATQVPHDDNEVDQFIWDEPPTMTDCA